MNQEKIARLMAGLNKSLVNEEVTLEEVEALIQSLIRHFLDNLTDIADIDYFQDRLNDMVDKYVDSNFEDAFDEKMK